MGDQRLTARYESLGSGILPFFSGFEFGILVLRGRQRVTCMAQLFEILLNHTPWDTPTWSLKYPMHWYGTLFTSMGPGETLVQRRPQIVFRVYRTALGEVPRPLIVRRPPGTQNGCHPQPVHGICFYTLTLICGGSLSPYGSVADSDRWRSHPTASSHLRHSDGRFHRRLYCRCPDLGHRHCPKDQSRTALRSLSTAL